MAGYPKNEKRQGSKPTPRSNGTGKRVNHNSGVKKSLKGARQAEARARAAEREALTPQQILKNLDKHFGAGQGAKRERERLARRIEREAEQADAQKAAKKNTKT